MTTPAPVPLPDEVRRVLASGGAAHLVTINADGGPHVDIVSVRVEDEAVVVDRARNIERDERVALAVGSLVVYGRARAVDGGVRITPEAYG